MRRGALRFAVFAVLSVVAAAGAGAEDFGDISVTAEPVLSPAWPHTVGYAENRWLVQNRSATHRHRVELIGPATRGYGYGASGSIERLSRAATLEPGSGTVIRMFKLARVPLGGDGLRIEIDGLGQRQTLPSLGWSSGDYKVGVPVLTTRSVSDIELLAALERINRKEAWALTRSELPAAAWSSTWLAYTSFAGIMLSSADYSEMPPPVRAAIWQYVLAGGTLVVDGPFEPPLDCRGEHLFAGWSVITCYAGFGQCFHVPAGNLTTLEDSSLEQLDDALKKSALPWKDVGSYEPASPFRVLERSLSLPAAGLFVVMLGFAVVAGPASIWLLARRKKRIWILWTVPALSLATSVAVVAYALLSEGFQRVIRTETLTVLDETSLTAATIGWTGFYATVAPPEGLRFGGETELTPRGTYSRDHGMVLDWTDGQHLANGWIQSRVSSTFMVRKCEGRRERLNLRPEGEGVVIAVNGLGAAIDRLWVADRQGDVYTAANFAAGAEMTLTASDMKTKGEESAFREMFARPWFGQSNRIAESPEKSLFPGSYVAILSASPFVEEGLARARTRYFKSVVFGISRLSYDAR